MTNKNTSKSIFAYTTLGIQLAVLMVIFVYGGFRLDNYLKTSPLFVALGAFSGFGIGLYNLIKGLKQMDKASEKGNDIEDKKNKWL